MPRLFVAIDLPDATKDQILNLREDDLPPGRWPRRDALQASYSSARSIVILVTRT